MALTPEWLQRIKRWEEWLWKMTYRPLGEVSLSGFATTIRLTPEQAQASNFHPMPAGTEWGSKWEYGWFKGQVTLPAEAQGKRIAVKFAPGGECLVWINGRVEGSVGWGHKEITLSRKAAAGTTYDFLIESYAGHGRITVGDGPNPHGYQTVPPTPEKQVKVGANTFGIWLEDVYQLALDMTTLHELRDGIDPLGLRVAEIDEGLMDVTRIVDLELPEEEMLVTVRKGRKRLAGLLDKKNGPSMPTLYAFGHAHIDVAWLWPLAETERKMARTAINQMALFEEYPQHRFLQSQPHLYMMMKALYPELYERFKAKIKTGQLIPDGGMWIEADTNVSGGEALIRQVLYGQRYYREELGVESRVLWLPDVFGYSGAMPQILKGCGMVGFATQKITWAYGGGDPFPYNTFWWEGIDGSAIPAHIFTDYNSQTRPKAVMERWNSRLQKNGINSFILAFGWGDGGGGPERNHLEFLRRVEDLEGMPKVKLSSPAEFFKDLEKQGLPKERYVGELYFQSHRGTYTSQAKTKKGNRKSELALRDAELWGSAARALKGFAFDDKTLYESWVKVMLNQFHDILPGSSIQRVYEEAEALYAEVLQDARDTAKQAAQTFVSDGEGVTVFNSLTWPRKVLVDVSGGQAEVEVPGMGWKTVSAPSALAAGDARALAGALDNGGAFLENELLRAEFNANGEITRLLDKASSREQLQGLGNQLRMYKDVPDIWDAWDLNSMTEDVPVELDANGTLEVFWSGGLVAKLRLHRKLNNSQMTQVISLRRGSRRIDFETGIDWQESHKLLKVNFPANIHAEEAVHEVQFGHLRRPTHKSRPYDADRFEVSAHKWSALTEEGRGVAVLNDCKYGLSVKGSSLNLTLLKSGTAPDMVADRGLQTFTYALYFWTGSLSDSGVVQQAYDLNVPALALKGSAAEGSLFEVSAPNVVIETVKPAEDGTQDVIVRLYESMRTATRCTLKTGLPVKQVVLTNLVEEGSEPVALEGGKMTLEFRPFEIKTLRLKM